MTSLQYKPPPPLGNFVHCIWYSEGISEGGHTHERLMPNGEATIVFNLMDAPIRIYHSDDVRRFNTYGPAILSGARTSYFVIGAAEQERVLGIQFRPGGAFPFFREPADAMENSSIALEDLWRARARELRERLVAASSIQAMFQIIELDLLEQLARPLARHPAIDYALRHFQRIPHATTVTRMTELIGLSPRRFIQLFRQQVGLTPKAFCRVRRFQQALTTVHEAKPESQEHAGFGSWGGKRIDWTQVAMDCGYYDQAHFIHDFQSFSGLTPSAYLAAATPHLNHIPIV
jgi:AraC-like DNA-binding protein